jgi:hypothetical protein
VRTILSFSIQIEMEGELPWRIGRPRRKLTDNHPLPRDPS